jgi:hypothetical protein
MAAAAAAATMVASPAAAASGANVAPASGKALLLIPLKLTKINDLNFGTVVTSNAYGTVSMDAGTGVRTYAGGVTGNSTVGVPGYFGGAGSPGQLVVVVLTPATTLSDGAGHSVTVVAMSLDQNGNPLRTVDATNKTFFVGVGGVLGIPANTPDGTYSNTFQVTANYL